MYDRVIWLSVDDFQEKLLPAPPSHLMPADVQIKDMSEIFETITKKYTWNTDDRFPEDVLADEFSKIINDDVLKHVGGRKTKLTLAKRNSTFDSTFRDTTLDAASPADSSRAVNGSVNGNATAAQWSRPNIVDTVPSYSMRSFPDEGSTDEQGFWKYHKCDAGLFLSDTKLEPGCSISAHQRLFIEFRKAKFYNDPFEDRVDESIKLQYARLDTVLKQLISSASRLFECQHRTATFSLFIIGRKFLFMFWDRSGLIVTEKVDYVKNTRTLLELLLGFCVLTDDAQGMDTTATLLNEDSDEYKLMDKLADKEVDFHVPVVSLKEGTLLPREVKTRSITVFPSTPPTDALPTPVPSSNESSGAHQEPASDNQSKPYKDCDGPVNVDAPEDESYVFTYMRKYFAESIVGCPRYKLKAEDEEFLVGKPITRASELIGRGTRGYVAYHIRSKTFVFVKDEWRPSSVKLELEGDVLAELNANDVVNVPTLLCHGDVSDQATRVSDFWLNVDPRSNEERKVACQAKRQGNETLTDAKYIGGMGSALLTPHYVHYRIVVKEVCLPLAVLWSGHQLVSFVADCIEAHYQAVERCRIIHRDISTHKILILPTFCPSDSEEDEGALRVRWKGVLTGWELATRLSGDTANDKSRAERVGTWTYMSVASLRNPYHIVEIADEMESMFNVLLFNALHYFRHSWVFVIRKFIGEYFMRVEDGMDGITICGSMRSYAIKQGELILDGSGVLSFHDTDENNAVLNELFPYMLRLFKARYAVLAYDAAIAKRPKSNLPSSSVAEEPQTQPERLSYESQTAIDLATLGYDHKKPKYSIQRPSDETFETAALLHNHYAVRQLVWKILRS